jgi:hypothetical protein
VNRPARGLAAVATLTVAVASGVAMPLPLDAAEAERPTEYEVKAAFLYNFAKFVKWPEGEPLGPTFVIAVLGTDPFGQVLDRTLAGKTVLDKTVEVRRIDSVAAATGAQILFIGSSEKARVAEILKALGSARVLTVAEMDGFAERGGMIGFKLREDVVRFDINLDQVNQAGLKMSSQLVRLAQRVISREGG